MDTIDTKISDTGEPTVKVGSVAIRYGIIYGIFSIVYFLGLTLTGVSATEGPARWIGILFVIAIIFIAQKHFKDRGDGYMTYGQGLGIGTLLNLVSGVISSVFTFFYVKFVDAEFIENIKQAQIAKMQEQGMTDQQIEQGMGFAAMFMTPTALLIFGIVGSVFVGFLVSLIVSIFTQKRNENPF